MTYRFFDGLGIDSAKYKAAWDAHEEDPDAPSGGRAARWINSRPCNAEYPFRDRIYHPTPVSWESLC